MKHFLISAIILPIVILLSDCKVPETDLPKIDLHVHLNYAFNSLGNSADEAYEKAGTL